MCSLFILVKYIKYIHKYKIYNIDKLYIDVLFLGGISREQIIDLLGMIEFTEKASENHSHKTDRTVLHGRAVLYVESMYSKKKGCEDKS